MTHHLVGMTEIGHMLGVSRQRVAQIVASYDDFPAPEAEIAAGRIWSRTAVETWISSHPERPAGRPETKVASDLPDLTGKGKRRGRGLFTRFTQKARQTIVLAQEQARLLQHNYIGTEHLLLGLLSEKEGVAYRALTALDITFEECRQQVLELIGAGSEPIHGHIPFTPRSKKVLEIALREALALQHNYIGTEHILLALIREGDGVAPQILEILGCELSDIREAVIETLMAPKPDVAATLDDRIKQLEERLAKLEGDDEPA